MYFKAVAYTIRWNRYKKDRDTLDMLREFEFFMNPLPPVPPQANIRGVKAKLRAYAILSHVYRQA